MGVNVVWQLADRCVDRRGIRQITVDRMHSVAFGGVGDVEYVDSGILLT
jgi:hypothetical protein